MVTDADDCNSAGFADGRMAADDPDRRRPRGFRGARAARTPLTERRSCSYTGRMAVATSRVEVGVRDLKNNLSRYLDDVGNGTEVTVTDRGRPVARLVRIDASVDRLSDLIASGAVQPARKRSRRLPKRVAASGTVSDLVADQRR